MIFGRYTTHNSYYKCEHSEKKSKLENRPQLEMICAQYRKIQSKIETWQIRCKMQLFAHKKTHAGSVWPHITYFSANMEFDHIFIALAVQLKNC